MSGLLAIHYDFALQFINISPTGKTKAPPDALRWGVKVQAEGLEVPTLAEKQGSVHVIIKREFFYGTRQGGRIGPEVVVMKFTGHCDYKSMKPYIDIAGKTKSDAMNTFANSLSL